MHRNAANERIKHEYLIFLEEGKGLSPPSIDAVAKALSRFEEYTRGREFKKFHRQQAVGFKKHLAEQLNLRTRERLSKATVYSTLGVLKTFFQWLAHNPVGSPVLAEPSRLRKSGQHSRLQEFVQADVETVDLPGLFDEIYHLASPASPPWYLKEPLRTISANVDGTLHLLRLLRPQRPVLLYLDIRGLRRPSRFTAARVVSGLGRLYRAARFL